MSNDEELILQAEFRLNEDNKIRGDQLADEIGARLGAEVDPMNGIHFMPPRAVIVNAQMTPEQVGEVADVVSRHEPVSKYTDQDYLQAQAQEAYADFAVFKAGLRELSARDKSYAMVGRAFAIHDGADDTVISGIQDRATAAAYITNKAEWQALPASGKAWAGDHLEAFALLLQALLVTERL